VRRRPGERGGEWPGVFPWCETTHVRRDGLGVRDLRGEARLGASESPGWFPTPDISESTLMSPSSTPEPPPGELRPPPRTLCSAQQRMRTCHQTRRSSSPRAISNVVAGHAGLGSHRQRGGCDRAERPQTIANNISRTAVRTG
jgi:hypothetical protein